MTDGKKIERLTIGDIAKELGVSKTTVSRAISGKGRIGTETREKVLQFIEEHHYRPNVIAKGLAQSRTYNIGLVIPGDYNIAELPFFQNCMLGISKIASAFDYDVLVFIAAAEDISRLQRVIVNHKVDGMILTRTLVEDPAAEYLKEEGIPFVTIGSINDDMIVQIDNDHQGACRELTEKLLLQGINKIALIGGSQNYMVNRNRLDGFVKACREHAGERNEKYIYLNVEEAKDVEHIVEHLLGEEIECIIAMDDYLCNCILNILQQRKITVPEKIKVASFYDSSFLENHIPSVTSISFDIEELGEMTCRVLLEMIEGKETQPRTLLGYRVFMRNSTKDI